MSSDVSNEAAYSRHCSEKYPYPCIRGFHFVNLMMSRNSVYPIVLEAGKAGDTLFLDLGCCSKRFHPRRRTGSRRSSPSRAPPAVGTDVRKLVRDGYPAANVFGCDLRPEYIELGHALFGDTPASSPIRFFTANVFDLPVESPRSGTSTTTAAAAGDLGPGAGIAVTDLAQLRGALTHVYTGALFHLFNEDAQRALALRLAVLLKREPGAVVFGRHQGLEEAGVIDAHLGRYVRTRPLAPTRVPLNNWARVPLLLLYSDRYGHSAESWARLWKGVFTELEGEAFAERIVVQAALTGGFTKEVFRAKDTTRMLYWSVRIV